MVCMVFLTWSLGPLFNWVWKRSETLFYEWFQMVQENENTWVDCG